MDIIPFVVAIIAAVGSAASLLIQALSKFNISSSCCSSSEEVDIHNNKINSLQT